MGLRVVAFAHGEQSGEVIEGLRRVGLFVELLAPRGEEVVAEPFRGHRLRASSTWVLMRSSAPLRARKNGKRCLE
jgi:hypothetical protein